MAKFWWITTKTTMIFDTDLIVDITYPKVYFPPMINLFCNRKCLVINIYFPSMINLFCNRKCLAIKIKSCDSNMVAPMMWDLPNVESSIHKMYCKCTLFLIYLSKVVLISSEVKLWKSYLYLCRSYPSTEMWQWERGACPSTVV